METRKVRLHLGSRVTAVELVDGGFDESCSRLVFVRGRSISLGSITR